MLDSLLPALANLAQPVHFAHLTLGVVVGIIVGILPGLSGVAGFSLLLPFIYGMDPVSALAMLIGLVAVVNTSDTFTSVLMGIPGTSASQATILDGFPLAKRGEAARALGAAFSSSLIGGLFGAAVLTLAVFGARPLVLAIGFGEQLMLLLLGLSMVGMLTGASPAKGLAACSLGLLLGAVGSAPATGEWRLAFDISYLADGLPLIVVALGVFAIPEIVDLLRRGQPIAGDKPLGTGWGAGLRDTLRNWPLVIRCSALGAVLGAVPGLGGAVVNWITYGHAVQSTKDRSEFGKGEIRGVIGPEAANNANDGGAFIPTILFGIPGSGGMAVFLGGMILIGIQPGIDMVGENLDLTYTIIWSLALANVLGAGICLIFAPQVARITAIPYTLIGPVMIVLIFFAAFQASRQWGDMVALFLAGVLGVYMRRFGWPRPAFLIGFVLSSRLEVSLYQAVQVYGLRIFERPLVWVLGLLLLISAVMAARFMRSRATGGASESTGDAGAGYQLAFCGAAIFFAAAAIWDSAPRAFLSQLYPITIGIITLLATLYVAGVIRYGPLTHPARYDAEAVQDEGSDDSRPAAEQILLWIAGFVGSIYLLGFVPAVVLFMAAYLIRNDRQHLLRSTILIICVVGLLALVSQMLVLRYPGGLLQEIVELPWPLR